MAKKAKIKSRLWLTVAICSLIACLCIMSTLWMEYTEAYAVEGTGNIYKEPVKVRGTVYLPTGNRTASGTIPMAYRTIAGRREDLGKTCNVYSIKKNGKLGELIFSGVIEDTGSNEGLKNGSRIDIFMNSEQAYRDFVRKYGDYFMVQIIEAEG